jgi:hypothetical protein
MKMFNIFVLLALMLTHPLAEAANQPRSNTAKKCNYIIPGFTNIAFGWDAAKIDVIAFFAGDYSGYGMYPVIDVTCNLNQTWVNPFDRALTYDIPDQISDQVRLSGGSYTDATIASFRTLNELYISMYASFNTVGMFGMFESSSSFSAYFNAIVDKQMTAGYIASTISSYELTMRPLFRTDLIKLSDDATFIVNQLVECCTQFNVFTVSKYEQFFEMFGTHLMTSIKLGGAFVMDFMTYNFYVNTQSSASVSQDIAANFLNMIGASIGMGGTGRYVSKLWLNASKVAFTCHGGSGGCPTNATYAKYPSMIFQNPWPLGGRIVSLSNLMPPSIKLAFDFAVINHLSKAYLSNTIKMLTSFLNNIIVPNTFDCAHYSRYCPEREEMFRPEAVLFNCAPTPAYTNTVSQYNEKINMLRKNISVLIAFATSINKDSIVNQTQLFELAKDVSTCTNAIYKLTLTPTTAVKCQHNCLLTLIRPFFPIRDKPVVCTKNTTEIYTFQ